MNNELEFSLCLKQLLDILGISGTRLAKAINVDPSLVSKWRNGRRVISPSSNHLNQISNYIFKNVTNTYQEKAIWNISDEYNIPIEIEASCSLKKYVHAILSTTNQASIIKHQNNKERVSQVKVDAKNTLDDKYQINENTISSYKNTNCNSISSKKFDLVLGPRNILNESIGLLKSALDKPCPTNEPILITFFSESKSFSDFEDIYLEYCKVLMQVMEKGWNIKFLIRLNGNINRNLMIINEIKMLAMSGRFCPYYIKKYNFWDIPRDYIVVPTVGTLSSIGSQDINKLDSAFLTRDKQTTQILKNHINQLLKLSSPILNTSPNIKDLDLLSKIAVLEEYNGDRYSFEPCLSIFSIPLDLYEKYLYLNKNEMYNEKFKKRICCHKRRMETFIRQIKYYNYYDICSKKAIEALVKNYKYSYIRAKPSDILIYLKNTIHMLEKYENYHIALLNDNEIENDFNISWLIKDSYNVVIYNHNQLKEDSPYHKRIGFTISEPTLVNTFKHHFQNMWEEMAPICKDKKSVIFWLKNQIKSLI